MWTELIEKDFIEKNGTSARPLKRGRFEYVENKGLSRPTWAQIWNQKFTCFISKTNMEISPVMYGFCGR